MSLKRLMTVMAVMFLSSVSHAQKLGGGIAAGINVSTMKMADNDSTRFRVGFTGGLRIAMIPTRSVFGLELGLMYSQYGYNAKMAIDSVGNKVMYGTKSHYIEMPLLLNIYMRKWKDTDGDESRMVRLRVGPQVGFCIGGNDVHKINGKTKKQELIPWEKDSFNRFHYGITAAVSYWFFEVRYTCGLSNVQKGVSPSKNHVISILFSDIW